MNEPKNKADEGKHRSAHVGRYILIGTLTIAPLWVTWLVFDFLLSLLYRAGSPTVHGLAALLRPFSDRLADAVLDDNFGYAIAVVVTLLLLYLLGWTTTRVLGRRLITGIEALVQRIPVVQMVYGTTKRFISVVQERPAGLQRVVLINFPHSDMKALGFITRTMLDQTTGKELAAVYVPTAPNPTSGYIEIVPLEAVVQTDWTVEEAMSFVVTGGASGPPTVRFTEQDTKSGSV